MQKRSSQRAAVAVMLMIGALISSGCGLAARREAEAARAKAKAAENSLRAMKMQLEAAKAEAEAAKLENLQRVGSVIGLKPEMKDKYVELHANTWPGVLDQIKKSNIRNYSIYLTEMEGKLYLFAYYEYVGNDFEADMKKTADDPETQRWWKETDPCQIRLPGTPEGEQWLKIEEVFHTD